MSIFCGKDSPEASASETLIQNPAETTGSAPKQQKGREIPPELMLLCLSVAYFFSAGLAGAGFSGVAAGAGGAGKGNGLSEFLFK